MRSAQGNDIMTDDHTPTHMNSRQAFSPNLIWCLVATVWLGVLPYVDASPALPGKLPELHPTALKVTGKTHIVAAGANLQAVLDMAKAGDEVELGPGKTYIGNFVLRQKAGSGWITLRTATGDRLPGDGVRA